MNTTRRYRFWRDVRQTVNETPRMYFSTVTDVADLIRRLLDRGDDSATSKNRVVTVVRTTDKAHTALPSALRTKRHGKHSTEARQ